MAYTFGELLMRGPILVLTVPEEGGYYSLAKDPSAPIRIYSDRRIQDDIVTAKLGRRWRNRLTRSEFREAKRQAKAGISDRSQGMG